MPIPSMANPTPQLSVEECLRRIEEAIQENRKNLEPVITEFHCLLNKWDPQIKAGQRAPYKLVKDGFECDAVLKRIREVSQCPTLKIPQIRFKADQLSKSKRIALPNSTRKHKEPMLQWFDIHWETLYDDIQGWKNQQIPNSDE
jgi:hypothetical protein